jgi:2-dehydropantoate 2-reductase
MARNRIAVIGAGGIGGGAALAASQSGRNEVIICSRRPFDHLVVEREGNTYEVDAPVVTSSADVGIVDWVLLAVKSYQIPEATHWLEALCGPETSIVVLQNGIGHADRIPALPAHPHIVPAIVLFGGVARSPGRIVAAKGRNPKVCVPAGPRESELVDVMTGGWLRFETREDFHTAAWSKLCHNAVLGLTVLTGGGNVGSPELRELAERLTAECVAVARADGANLPEDAATTIMNRLASFPADHASSILVDRRAGRPLEWEERNKAICDYGRRTNTPTPVSDMLVPLLAAANQTSISR